MNDRNYSRLSLLCSALFLLIVISSGDAQAQDKIKIAYSSTDTLNQIWTIAQEAGFYKKHGLDVDLVYIGSTTIGVAAIVAQDIQVGNAAGSGGCQRCCPWRRYRKRRLRDQCFGLRACRT